MSDVSVLPLPSDLRDRQRIEHTRLRRRLLYSDYREDLLYRIRQQLGPIRSDVLGEPDLTANPYLSVWSQVSVLYNEEPEVLAPPGSEALIDTVADLGLWPLMQREQRDTLALRDMLLNIEVDEGRIAFRPVYPDMVTAVADPRRPNRAVILSEALWSSEVSGYTWHTRDIRDPANPTYTVTDTENRDVTDLVLGGNYSGEGYYWRDGSGAPLIPYAWYHAAETAWLFDPYTYREVVEGSLNIGVLLTYYQHLVRNAAWAQRYIVGARLRGAGTAGEGTTARREAVADPAVVMDFEQDQDASNVQIGQWGPPVDPEAVLRSISAYERRILLLAGLQPPDVTRQEADVRSGYSLAVARESVREQQRIYEPCFRKGDQSMFRIAACLLNRTTGTSYSENPRDYRIAYRGLPETPQEIQARLSQLKAEQEAGHAGPVSAYLALHPNATRVEAVSRLAEAATERAEVEAAIEARTGATAPPVAALDPSHLTMANTIVTQCARGEIAPETAKAMLVTMVGLAPAAAEAICNTIQAHEPPPEQPAPVAA